MNSLKSDEKLWANLQTAAMDRRENHRKAKILGTLGLVLISGISLGLLALWVQVTQPREVAVNELAPEVAEEKTRQKLWVESIQKVDHTVEIDPINAKPGERQRLVLNAGVNVYLPALRSQLNKPGHPCNQRGWTIETCAALSEINNIDNEVYSSMMGARYVVGLVKPGGKLEVVRPLDEYQIRDNANFRKMALDAAIAPVKLSPDADPIETDRRRDQVLQARTVRLERTDQTDAAQKIREIKATMRGSGVK